MTISEEARKIARYVVEFGVFDSRYYIVDRSGLVIAGPFYTADAAEAAITNMLCDQLHADSRATRLPWES
jgi:hypothetical protein